MEHKGLRPLILSVNALHLDRIGSAAVAAYPAECCGLLVGVIETPARWRVTRVVPTHNRWAQERNDIFEIDPVIHLALRRCLRGRHEDLIGHYHSHPNGQAYPSATDRAMVSETHLVWVIVAVNSKSRAEATAAYRLDGKDVHPVRIVTLSCPPETRQKENQHAEQF